MTQAPPQPVRPHRFQITPAQIDRVVARFYARIRQHPELGPVFHAAIGPDGPAWRAHEARIAAFWRNAILQERSYDGNPMAVHRANPGIRSEHFAPWLDLFGAVAREELPEQTAAALLALAQRIGRSLAMAVEAAQADPKAPPRLF